MFKKMGFKKKLLSLSAFLSFMIVAVGLIGYFSSQKVQIEYKQIVNKNLPKLDLASEMFLSYQQVRISLRTLGLTNLSKDEADSAIRSTLEAIERFEKANARYVSLGFLDKEKELYEVSNVAWLDFKQLGGKALELYKSNNPDDKKKLIDIFLKDCPEKAKAFSITIQSLNEFHKNIISNSNRGAEELSKRSNFVSLLVIMVALFIGLSVGLVISSLTTKELNSITQDLAGNSSEVSGTVSGLRLSVETLSTAATNQTSSIQKTAASIEEITAMVQRNAESAIESAKLSAQSKDEASAGKHSVEEMILAMQEINHSNQNIQLEIQNGNQKISDIVKIIKEIENKTKVINEIVFQTKLLSFNASVEAARAGEHGKGFAVVAEEVGNLANMSGNASKEITNLLIQSTTTVNKIIEETTSNVQALMNDARSKAERGSKIAESCGSILEKIVSNADHLSEMVESISSASKEQSLGVKEISQAVQELDRVTQINSVETKNTAAAASSLSKQVHLLNGSSYRLKTLIQGKSEFNKLAHSSQSILDKDAA